MEPIDWIDKIEKEYNVKGITYDGIMVWPILRPYVMSSLFFHKLGEKKKRQTKIDQKTLTLFIKHLFYGLQHLFRKKKYFMFSSSERRKPLKGVYHDRVLEGVAKLTGKQGLYFENPYPIGHYKSVPTENLVSESINYALSFCLSKIFFRKSKVKGKEVWEKVEEDLKISLNIQQVIQKFLGQKLWMGLLIRYHKPKAAFVVNSATLAGYIYAFKSQKIPVVELQHGVINSTHPSYNVSIDLGKSTFPDFLCVYGEYVKKIFNQKNYFIERKNVLKIGYYFFDELKKEKIVDERFEQLSRPYKRKVCVSLLDTTEDEMIKFVNSASNIDSDTFYALLPRTKKDYSNVELHKNIKIIDWLTTYEVILLCDIHSTINSSCALEAPVLGVRNVLINLNGSAKRYYSDILIDEQLTLFADTPEEFVDKIKSLGELDRDEIVKRASFLNEQNHMVNISGFIKSKVNNDFVAL